MMASKVMSIIFYILLSLVLQQHVKAQNWIRAGYWYKGTGFPTSLINSALFTHLLCAFADLNSTSYELSLPSSDENKFSTFTEIVKQKNPSVTTLLSIGGGGVTDSDSFPSMASNSSHRKTFIDSSMKIARLYGFQGLDLAWIPGKSSSDMNNLGVLLQEWRRAIELEARNSSQVQLILTARVDYSPRDVRPGTYPVQPMQQFLDWVHVQASDYFRPDRSNFTGAHAALYNPHSVLSTDYGIKAWIEGGLSANKLVLCLPYYGYAWTLSNPVFNGIGAPATGLAINTQYFGFLRYYEIKSLIKQAGSNVSVVYDATYVVNYCTIGTVWIGFDDVYVVEIKVSYAKKKGLRGYYVWEVPYDDNWVLSNAAANEEANKNGQNRRRFLATILTTTAAVVLLLGFVMYYYWRTGLKLKGSAKPRNEKVNQEAIAGDFNSKVPS